MCEGGGEGFEGSWAFVDDAVVLVSLSCRAGASVFRVVFESVGDVLLDLLSERGVALGCCWWWCGLRVGLEKWGKFTSYLVRWRKLWRSLQHS